MVTVSLLHSPVLNALSFHERSSDVTSLFDKKAPHYTAVVVESNNSYIGREVMHDL